MADAPDLGSGSERIGGSSPLARTMFSSQNKESACVSDPPIIFRPRSCSCPPELAKGDILLGDRGFGCLQGARFGERPSINYGNQTRFRLSSRPLSVLKSQYSVFLNRLAWP